MSNLTKFHKHALIRKGERDQLYRFSKLLDDQYKVIENSLKQLDILAPLGVLLHDNFTGRYKYGAAFANFIWVSNDFYIDYYDVDPESWTDKFGQVKRQLEWCFAYLGCPVTIIWPRVDFVETRAAWTSTASIREFRGYEIRIVVELHAAVDLDSDGCTVCKVKIPLDEKDIVTYKEVYEWDCGEKEVTA